MRLRALFLLVCACPTAWAGLGFAASASVLAQEGSRPSLDIVEVPGVLDPPLVNYLLEQIGEANRREATLLVLQLDSAGALVPLGSLVARIRDSRVPVAVYVGPRNAQAASGAALLVAAAHIPAMSTAATIGPIHPADLTITPRGEKGRILRGSTRAVLSRLPGDATAYLDRRLDAEAALRAGSVRFATPGLAELLKQLDGLVVETSAGRITLRLPSDETLVRFHKPGPIRRALHTLTSAALVYLLLLSGVALIVFEIFQPGFGVAGVTGALLLAGAGYGMLVLPVAWWAAGLAVGGLLLLTLDVKLDGLGIPTIAGTITLLVGSLGMFPVGALRAPEWLVLLGVAGALVFFVPVMTIVRRQRRPVGERVSRDLVGRRGEVRSMLNPEGFIWVSGALWRARSEDGTRMRVGEPVEVSGLSGEVLVVRRTA